MKAMSNIEKAKIINVAVMAMAMSANEMAQRRK
jgi:hypothetical protein